MTFYLPELPFNKKSKIIYLKSAIQKRSLVDKFLNSTSERTWSFVTSFLAILCLGLIFANSNPKMQSVITPLQNFTFWIQNRQTHETFSFAPASSHKKLEKIDYTGLTTLAFYDLPVDPDGTLVRDTSGYEALKSQEAKTLFRTARQHNTKVVVTLTLTYNNGIRTFLDSKKAQDTLIKEAISEVKEAEIDGVTIDFEFEGSAGSHYRDAYTAFLGKFTEEMHRQIPDSQVSVALGSSTAKDSLYDTGRLSQSVDKVFLMAYSFAVPETDGNTLKSPNIGQASQKYDKAMHEYIKSYSDQIPVGKLVIERAWYGSGENYPMYKSAKARPLGNAKNENTLSTPLTTQMINRLVLDVPRSSRDAARKNLPLIAQALEKEEILNSNVLAYALATIEHETAGTFEPIEEIKGKKSARRLGYEGGTNYHGRGFIQLTHLSNYKDVGQRIGMGTKLAENPELASEPEIAAAVLAAFFKDNNVSYWATQGDFMTARLPINPDAQGYSIALLAWKYLEELV